MRYQPYPARTLGYMMLSMEDRSKALTRHVWIYLGIMAVVAAYATAVHFGLA